MTARRNLGTTDPTAGVPLVVRSICPRCGIEKGNGRPGDSRRGLCRDCSSVLRMEGNAVARAWAA